MDCAVISLMVKLHPPTEVSSIAACSMPTFKVACAICRVISFGDLGGRHDALSQHILNRFIYFAIVHHIASQTIFLVVH